MCMCFISFNCFKLKVRETALYLHSKSIRYAGGHILETAPLKAIGQKKSIIPTTNHTSPYIAHTFVGYRTHRC